MCGILTFLNESKSRFAIDPLEDYYSSVSEFVAKRDSSVMYYKAKGENIPFENKTFDLIILDNVLDHCEDPVLVLDEINRVLGEKGIIYFRQNTYNCYGKFMRSLMELFIIDKGHPFTFTKRKLKRMFAKYDLKITHKNRIGYFPAWWGELTSKTIKDKIKAFLFITRDKVTYVLRKN
ncbi:hypothetical protein SDC9_118803 [bioreactor metagenome]|uniref:Methyltransferase type 11 domain-containing protein n=1 Tax=bioreactor metagenome TaxID=1076179 RepID=A0A645C2G3_9ZZZZ